MTIERRRSRLGLEKLLDQKAAYLLASAVIVSIAITIPRLGNGIPMSVDTTSHLYRILFLHHWLQQGIFPFWSPDWYAGSPAILLYPPLGYYMTLGFAMIGIDPVLAYKLVDVVFYWFAPVMIYFLGKEVAFSKGESALGALIFSVVPEVIENYLFFDRFPTVISIPIFCGFVIMFHRSLANPRHPLNILGAALMMSALVLTHHLSALIAGFVAAIMIILAMVEQGLKRPLLVLGGVAVGTLGLTAFWIVPFLMSVRFFAGNQFYNRNVIFPFLRLSYFSYDVVILLLGVVQFVLATVAVTLLFGGAFKKRIPFRMTMFLPTLIGGMAFFEAGERLQLAPLSFFGQIVVAASFVVLLAQFALLNRARRAFARKNGTILAAIWFIIFLWLGLGFLAQPLLWVPPVGNAWIRTMDVYRIWLYLALPMSILAGRGLLRSVGRFWSRRRAVAIILLFLVITPVALSAILRANYSLTANVNPILPYTTANANIPQAILEYFTNDPAQGRILGLNVPFWIYILPSYVNKPIIDGWYPQTKLVRSLVEINDYRIDDLENAPNQTVRVNTWISIIHQRETLAITWVIVGERRLANILNEALTSEHFVEEMATLYGRTEIIVFKAVEVPSLVESNLSVLGIERPNPDTITINFAPSDQPGSVLLKEAYFPNWTATADGRNIEVMRDDETGYIQLIVPAGSSRVTLAQRTDATLWNMISVASLAAWVVLAVLLAWRRRGIG